MKEGIKHFGKHIVSGMGLVLGIVLALVLIGGVAWYFIDRAVPQPRETVKVSGQPLLIEALHFHYRNGSVEGRIFRPSGLENAAPTVVYCQNKAYGEHWCKALAAAGCVCYSFDLGDGAKERQLRLKTVIQGLGDLKEVDKKKIYILGEGNGCPDATFFCFDHPQRCAGLMLVSPGFNPLEVSRKAKNYNKPILVLDGNRPQKSLEQEILDYIN